ncbi:unnamed protein product [Porites lobata]|uniref:Proteasome maturation protein n=1 Tax=Porites lobata TaxID=104759 RepID=A0ABN8NZE0_9CNID|nr:unnamed protein product [Porites lobata]
MSYSEKTIEISLESLFQSSWFWGKHWTFSTNNSNNNGESSHESEEESTSYLQREDFVSESSSVSYFGLSHDIDKVFSGVTRHSRSTKECVVKSASNVHSRLSPEVICLPSSSVSTVNSSYRESCQCRIVDAQPTAKLQDVPATVNCTSCGIQSALPSKVQPATEVRSSVGNYGVPDHMRTGFSNVRSGLTSSHPLEATEKNFLQNQEMLDFKMLRNTQGLQAPLKLQMERSVASKIQRLPCLPSSMVALDTLMGIDESLGFEDFLNVHGDSEVMSDPHLTMEYKLGLH